MRVEFANHLHAAMSRDRELRLCTADIGYGVLNQIRIDYPDRFIDFGAAEQLMIGAACGMALSGFRPICYSITPFVLYRPFEWLRNYLQNDGINVKLVGAGRGRDYGHLGFTHWADDDEAVLAALPDIKVFKPEAADIPDAFDRFLKHPGPAYLNLIK